MTKRPSVALSAPVPLGSIDELDLTLSGFRCSCQLRGSVLLVPLRIVPLSFTLCSVPASRLVVFLRLRTIPSPGARLLMEGFLENL